MSLEAVGSFFICLVMRGFLAGWMIIVAEAACVFFGCLVSTVNVSRKGQIFQNSH